MMNHGCILVLNTVKEEAKDTLAVVQGEAECPYCVLLHAECTDDSRPAPCDGEPPILLCFDEDT